MQSLGTHLDVCPVCRGSIDSIIRVSPVEPIVTKLQSTVEIDADSEAAVATIVISESKECPATSNDFAETDSDSNQPVLVPSTLFPPMEIEGTTPALNSSSLTFVDVDSGELVFRGQDTSRVLG